MPIEAVEYHRAKCDRCTLHVDGEPSLSPELEKQRVVDAGGRVIGDDDLLVLCPGCYLGLVVALSRDDAGLIDEHDLRLPLAGRVDAWLHAWANQQRLSWRTNTCTLDVPEARV